MQKSNNSEERHFKFWNKTKKNNFNHSPTIRCGHRFQNYDKFNYQQNRLFKNKHNHNKQEEAVKIIKIYGHSNKRSKYEWNKLGIKVICQIKGS